MSDLLVGLEPTLAQVSDFWAYDWGPILAVILFVGLPALALYHARSFVKKF